MFNYEKEIKRKKEFLLKIAPMTFHEAFRAFFEFEYVDLNDIDDFLSLSKRTVERYIYRENQPSKQTLIHILIVFSNSYEISETLLFKAGYSLLGNSWSDVANRTFLEQEGAISIKECNHIIDELNQNIHNSDEKIPKL